jgi:predicted permease
VAFGVPVLIFTLVVTGVTTLVVALAPVFRSPAANVLGAMRGRGVADTTSARTRAWLLGGQVALTFVLAVAATLLVRSFRQLRGADLGFQRTGVYAAQLRVPVPRGTPKPWLTRLQYYDRLFGHVGALPGVQSAAGTTNVPLTGEMGAGSVWRTDAPGASGRQPPTSAADQWKAMVQVVTPGYFDTMGIPLVRGRGFTASDRFADQHIADLDGERPAGVAVINEAMARRYWRDADPLGATVVEISDRSFAAHRTIVGIVRDVRAESVDSAASPTIYLPFAQHPGRALSLVWRSNLPPALQVSTMTHALRQFDQAIFVSAVRSLDEVVGGAMTRPRFAMLLVGSFAALALVIAAVGVFGVVGFLVTRRTQEIGVRVALGARPASVVRLVMAEGLRPVVLGVVAGGVAAFVVARLMRALLYALAPGDAVSFAIAAAVLLGASVVAALLPARRAASADPLRALRAE